MKEMIKLEAEVPEGIEFKINDGIATFKGKKGEFTKKLVSRKVKLSVEGRKIIIATLKKGTKREASVAGAFRAHIMNMIKGVTQGHVYKLKICAGHFPITVEVKGQDFVVKNFFGETTARQLKLRKGVSVKVEAKDVIVESVDKELAGETAASIEELTKRPGFDKRIFQDGIYIYYKDGKGV